MTSHQRIAAALSPAGTPETPAVICYEGIYTRDHWSQVTDCPWWYLHEPDVDRQVEWRSQMLARTGQDWFVLPGGASRAERASIRIEERADGVYRVDRAAGKEDRLTPPQTSGWSPSGQVASVHPRKAIETAEAIDAAIPAPPTHDPAQTWADGRDDLARAILAGPGRDLFPLSHVTSPLWACYGLWGFDGMMTMVADTPDLVKHACERHLARAIWAVRAAAALGVKGIWIEECMTDMVGPRHFAQLNLPCLQRLIGAIRESGMRSIYYYCGNPAGKWDLLLEAGADALSLEESKKGWEIEIDDVMRRVAGRCAVLGNLDAVGVLEQAGEEGLRAEIARQLRAGQRNGGRFIMSLGSPVTPATPVARVRRYCELVREMSATAAG